MSIDPFGFLPVRPENSELSEESLEGLLVALHQLRLRHSGMPIAIVPNRMFFTDECLRRFFGWTDEDLKR